MCMESEHCILKFYIIQQAKGIISKSIVTNILPFHSKSTHTLNIFLIEKNSCSKKIRTDNHIIFFYLFSFLNNVSGSMVACWHSDYTYNSTSRHNEKSSSCYYILREKDMAIEDKGHTRIWSWILYVPDKYRSHEESNGLFGCCR